jgi:stringent starvation protein B
MNAWLKFDAKFSGQMRTLSINLENVQYISIYDNMVLFHFSKEEILAVGPEDSPANFKADTETMDLIMQGLRRYKALGY